MTTRNAIGLNEETITAASMARQAIINGNFDVWQRGTSFTSATTPANSDDTYLCDRWVLLSDGNDIVDVSRESTIIPEGSTYSLKAEVETANKKFGFLQIVESVDSMKFAGKSASLSFQARTTTGHTIENVRASLLSWTGSPDLITSDVVSAWGAEGTNPTFASYGASPLTGWAYSKQITINNTGSELTNYQLKFTINRSTGSDSGFTVYVGTNCESDYDDIRFTTSDGTTLCDYWIESSSTSTADIWVEVPTVAASGNTTLYLYYGNSGASAVSNGTNTFPFFDDFPGSSLDTGKWENSGTPTSVTVSGGICTVYRNTTGWAGIKTKSSFGPYDISIVGKVKYGQESQFGITNVDDAYTNADAIVHIEYATSSQERTSNDGTRTDTSVTGELSNYHRDEKRWISGQTTHYRDGSLIATHTTNIPNAAGPVRAIAIYSMGGTNDGYIYLDWVLVRKYTATEPTVSAWGGEVAYGNGWTAENTATNLPITTSWTTYKIEGIDIDTAGVKNIGVFIWVDDTDAAADDLLYIAQVQLCAGDVALPFEPKTYAEELDSCKRYFQRLFTDGTNNQRIAQGFAVSTTSFRTLTDLDKEMRVTPTITTSSTASHFSVYNGLVHVVCSYTPTNTGSTPKILALGGTVASGLTAPDPLALLSAGTAQIWINLDAEL